MSPASVTAALAPSAVVGVPAVFTSAIDGTGDSGTFALSVSVTLSGGPVGGFALTVAVLARAPASISAWVSTYVALNVRVSIAPGARDRIGPPLTETSGSLSVTPVNVTVPVFLTTKL